MFDVSIRVDGVAAAIGAQVAFTSAVERSFQARARDVARDTAAAAAGFASWSRKIPPGIRYHGTTVEYAASAPALGRLAELRDIWAHPLFGNRRHWYAQRGRPFLAPAADIGEIALAVAAELAVEAAMKEVDL